jgi:hypothetical protein
MAGLGSAWHGDGGGTDLNPAKCYRVVGWQLCSELRTFTLDVILSQTQCLESVASSSDFETRLSSGHQESGV